MTTETKDLIVADVKLAWKEVNPILQPPLPDICYAPQAYYPSKLVPHTPASTDVTGLISDAADYFEKGGSWCQNSVANDDQICLVGSLLRMETGDASEVYQPTQPYRHPMTTAAVKKLSEHLSKKGVRVPKSRDKDRDPDFDRVSAWNDAAGRTKAEVIDLLKEVTK